jgi:hypothetical protein
MVTMRPCGDHGRLLLRFGIKNIEGAKYMRQGDRARCPGQPTKLRTGVDSRGVGRPSCENGPLLQRIQISIQQNLARVGKIRSS